MKIIAEDLSKRFNYQWIFKNFSEKFVNGNSYAILGPNGSGKSTLLQVLSSHLIPTEGKLTFTSDKLKIETEDVYKQLCMAAPYMSVPEEFTLDELLRFHSRFKDWQEDIDASAVRDILALSNTKSKQISYYSSGMKQRIKLALAFLTKGAYLLLDEPTSNLDSQGVDWYHSLVQNYTEHRLLIVASNQKHEYDFCKNHIDILRYKPIIKRTS